MVINFPSASIAAASLLVTLLVETVDVAALKRSKIEETLAFNLTSCNDNTFYGMTNHLAAPLWQYLVLAQIRSAYSYHNE